MFICLRKKQQRNFFAVSVFISRRRKSMQVSKYTTATVYVIFGFLLIAWFAPPVLAAEPIAKTKAQTVYVPAYSHIYSGIRGNMIQLATTLSIRNTDPKFPLTLTAVDYHDTKGMLIKSFIDKPVHMSALASERFFVTETDRSGGSGANFIVRWKAGRDINLPIIEAVMISTRSQLGISFTSRGQAIHPQD